MTVWAPGSPNSNPSDMICMDDKAESPEDTDLGSSPQSPKLSYVQTGYGLWSPGQILPCSVCVKVSSEY